jgi:hypothetical protein
MQNTFSFKAMKETHEQSQTKIDIDELKSGTTNITQRMLLLMKQQHHQKNPMSPIKCKQQHQK